MATTNTSTATPPYVSFGVFKSAIEMLAESVVPNAPLDRRVLNKFSGGDYAALMSGLRFLDLIDEEKKATEDYRALVNASKNPDKYKETLKEIIVGAYGPILGNVDLAHGTIAQVERVFRDAGVTQGQMLTKTIRFFLKAAADSGIPISPHITKPSRAPRNAAPKKNGDKRTRTKTTANVGERAAAANEIGAAMKTVALPGAKGQLTLSGTFQVFDLTGKERALVFEIIDKMKEFESGVGKGVKQ